MKNKQATIAAVAGGVLLICAGQALGQDWPQWRGPNRDGKVSGFAAPEKWPGTLTQKWQTTVGQGDATPALAGDRLYVFARQGSEEVTLCLNASDGKEVWQNKYTARAVTGPPGRHPGPRSSPAVAGGKVATLGVGGILSCLDAATGKEAWRKDEFPNAVPRFFAASSPLVVDGMCVAQLGGGESGGILAFDLATGDLKWKWTGEGPAYASPVLLTAAGVKQIVAHTDKSLVGLAAGDGKLLWQLPAQPQGRCYNSATPVVDGQTVFYTGQGKGAKAVKIEKQADGFAAKELWSNEKLGTGYNTPVLKDGHLYGLSDQGYFFCLNAQSGEAAWTDAAKYSNFGAIVDAGSVLLALPERAGLIAFKPSDKQYEEVARLKLSDTAIYAHPLVAGKRLFVKDEQAVTLWMLE